MAPHDVDLMIVTSFLPDSPGVGHAAPLARELALRAPAFNVESTCSSALVSLETACALVRTGQYRNVLVVVSCTYSRVADERDTLSWFLGDGAGAFIVSTVEADTGVLASKTISTAETCDTFYFELGHSGDARGVRPLIRCTPQTQRILRETAAGYVRECCGHAARAAGMRLADVDLFVFNTPTAWFAAACARALGAEFRRTVNTYPLYANVGPALMPINLHHAVRSGRLHRGDVVLVFTIGSVGTAAAALMRWGEVGVASCSPVHAGDSCCL
jgi:3-oxoacyl-[acyl-carrier-protein] synthase-3